VVNVRRDAQALLLVVAVAALYLVRGHGHPSPATAGVVPPSRAPALTRVDLDRLKVDRPLAPLGRIRGSIFATVSPTPVTILPRDNPVDPPVRPSIPPLPTPSPTSINLKFMGVVTVTDGPRVAVFLTGQKEILHGCVGETLAGRYKIVDLKAESVDIQEIVLGRLQRIRIGGR
jgi:hypothetical protein